MSEKSELKTLSDILLNLCDGKANLLHGVTVTHGYAAVGLGIEVIGDAEGSTDLVLTAVSLTDRAGLVKVAGKLACELIIKLKSTLGELLGKRKNGRCGNPRDFL